MKTCSGCGGITGEPFEIFAGTPCRCQLDLIRPMDGYAKDVYDELNRMIRNQYGNTVVSHNVAQILRSARDSVAYENDRRLSRSEQPTTATTLPKNEI